MSDIFHRQMLAAGVYDGSTEKSGTGFLRLRSEKKMRHDRAVFGKDIGLVLSMLAAL